MVAVHAVRWEDIRREPFRLLFPLGMLFGLVGVGHWLWYALGLNPSYSGFYHASIQIEAYLYCFIAGFLMTAIPRFAASFYTTRGELAAVLGLLVVLFVSAGFGQWVWAGSCFAGLLLSLAIFIGRRFAARRVPEVQPPVEFVWIFIGLLHGLIGTALLVLGQAGILPPLLLAVGRPMAQQGFVLGIVIGIGGFMGPRLMGHLENQARWLRRREVSFHIGTGLLFFCSFWLEGAGAIRAAYLLRAAVATLELGRMSRFYQSPRAKEEYIRMLRISIGMVLLGLWSAGLIPSFRVAAMHMTFLGGFSLMIFSMATMVVLSHAGEVGKLKQPLWVLRIAGIGVGLSLLSRIAADLFPAAFFQLLGAAAVFWMTAGLGWLIFAVPKVLRTIPAGELEKVHEQAKSKLLRPR